MKKSTVRGINTVSAMSEEFQEGMTRCKNSWVFPPFNPSWTEIQKRSHSGYKPNRDEIDYEIMRKEEAG